MNCLIKPNRNSLRQRRALGWAASGLLLSLAVGAARADLITAKGSDTMVILAQKWAQQYMAQHPDTRIEVSGGGSGTGIAALQNGTTDLAHMSRPLRSREIARCVRALGARPIEVKVALDGLTLYVHETNPVNDLTLTQLQRLFTGEIKNWKELGGPDLGITLYSRENSSGTYESFKESVLGNRDFVSRVQMMPGTAAVVQAVAKDPSAIGYGGAAYGVAAKRLGIRLQDSSPVWFPTEEAIRSHDYPLWRYLYIYVSPARDNDEVENYLNWIRSPDGQAIVAEVGYFPLSASDLAAAR